MKKAMLLAAGRGERLRPLTDGMPKPLLRVGERSLIEHNLIQLRAAGIEEVVVNVFYHAKQIIEAIGDGSRFGLKVTFSFESEELLGTGGGVFQALEFLGNEPFILLSSDIWTDYPFEKLSLPNYQVAHLVMVNNPYFHPEGDYALLDSNLLSAAQGAKLTYSSISVIHPRLFDGYQAGVFQLAPLFVHAMEQKLITGELYEGQWFNVGTVEELKRLEEAVA